jgi:hypothetical protein
VIGPIGGFGDLVDGRAFGPAEQGQHRILLGALARLAWANAARGRGAGRHGSAEVGNCGRHQPARCDITGCRQGDSADAALASSTRFIELDAAAWTNNSVRAMARSISHSATFDLASATLSVLVAKRRVP